jgi:Domain of unknown function DUF29
MASPAQTKPSPSVTRSELAAMYEPDETAWLEATSRLIREGRLDELDYENLASYLEDMAKRDRREVVSRLTTLVAHILKWVFQPEKRSTSWQLTILNERHELDGMLTGVLRRHAEEQLPKCYARAVKQAAIETDLPATTFAADRPYSLDWILTENLF